MKSGQHIAVPSLKLSLKLSFYLLANIAYNIFLLILENFLIQVIAVCCIQAVYLVGPWLPW